uniref:Uncharacterized protein n=1 Tax=Globisporangium ultimum (strain ATCC 200006 / CBS 805.95 / DAOM BR144) TaxID=431595 RepID=K3WR56_GLOUD
MSDRDRFLRDLIAALQENEELTRVSASGTDDPSVATTSASINANSRRPDSESDDSNDDDDARMFTGFFQSSMRQFDGVSRIARDGTDVSSSGGAIAADLSAPMAALEAYEKLQFDFPQVDEWQLKALAEFYYAQTSQAAAADGGDRGASDAVSRAASAMQKMPITTTLVDGLVYLNEKQGSGAAQASANSATTAPTPVSRSSEGSSLLAASVLLFIFEYLLRNADQIRVRALLAKLHVPPKVNALDYNAPDHSVPPVLNNSQKDAIENTVDVYVERYAAQEDPDDLSEVYEGTFPTPRAPSSTNDWALQRTVNGDAAVSFLEKLHFLASQTFSSTFGGISPAKWEAWRIDACLSRVMQHLVLEAKENSNEHQQQQVLYGHPHGEWTRYLYILRDRVLRFPNASTTGIRSLKELVQCFQPSAAAATQWSKEIKKTAVDETINKEVPVEIQRPHHLVYRVLAELVLSKEFQQRSAQVAQRELARAVEELLPLIIQEIQRLGAAVSNTQYTTVDENDDLVLILIQLVHFLLFASSSRRVAADILQESGCLRTLLTLMPADPAAIRELVTSKGFWFTPLLRLLVECGLWNAEFAEYIVRVPKFAALLPIVYENADFPAEFAVLLVALFHHQLTEFAALKPLLAPFSSSSSSIWGHFVASALFPQSCASYLDSMKKLQDAVYFLECVIDAVAAIRPPILDQVRTCLQGVYPTFGDAFVYPAFASASSVSEEQQFLPVITTEKAQEQENEGEVEERGQAESLQFLALRNKLRQYTKTILLSKGSGSPLSAASYSSSKLD